MGRGALSQAEGDGIAALMERLAALEAQIEALSAPGGARPVPHSSCAARAHLVRARSMPHSSCAVRAHLVHARSVPHLGCGARAHSPREVYERNCEEP